MKELVPAYEIKYDDKNHRYFLDGKRLCSVTTYTGIIDKSAALMYWSARVSLEHVAKTLVEIRKNENWIELLDELTQRLMVEDGYKSVFKEAQDAQKTEKEIAAAWGNRIHDLIETKNKGGKINIAKEVSQVRLGMTAYLDWESKVDFKPIYSELLVASKILGYAGRLDAIGYVNGILSLVDYKSCNGLYVSNKAQVAGYYQAGLEMYPKQVFDEIKNFWVIRFGKVAGEFEDKQILDIEPEIRAFNDCRSLYKWNQIKWK